MNDNTGQKALEQAIRYIGMRPHSSTELKAKLRRKGFDSDVVSDALSKLERLGLIDDRSYGRNYLESVARHKPTGKAKLRADLMRKGLPDSLIDELLGNYDSLSLCHAAAEKKLRFMKGTDEEKKKKITSFLRNRGFDWSAIRDVLSHIPDIEA